MSQIQPTDYSARRKAILLIISVAVVGGLFIVAFESYRSDLANWFLSEPEKIRQKLNWVPMALTVLSAPVFIGAVYLWRIGQSVVNAQRFPPPGVAVIVNTPIITGEKAKFRGRLFKFCSSVLAIYSVAVPVALWWILQSLANR